jgi:DNA-binding CsgD family transcriptional regulator
MMIILYNLILIEGLAVVFYLFHQQKSFPFNYLRDIIYKLLLINSFVFLRLVTYYLKQILSPSSNIEALMRWIIPIEHLLSFIIIFMLAYFFLKISYRLLNREMSVQLIRLLIGLLFVFSLFWGAAISIHFVKKSSDLIFYANTSTLIMGMIIIILSLVYLILSGHKMPPGACKEVGLSFGYPYVLIAGAVLLLIVFPNRYSTYLTAVIFMSTNTFNFIWFRYFFLKHYGCLPYVMVNKANILKAIEDYQLSNREGEILELLLQGKENKEIEKLLYISINTVKNHVHSIYKKMQVNTRQQLFKKIQKR